MSGEGNFIDFIKYIVNLVRVVQALCIFVEKNIFPKEGQMVVMVVEAGMSL